MPRIAYLVSSAREIDLDDNPGYPTGYWAEEALKPYERFIAAGVDVVVLTADGEAPVPDPYSLERIFNYPDADRDFFASVYRTFHQDPDDIRITLDHTTQQELMASRRITLRLIGAGKTEDEAHALVCEAAKIAWAGNRKLVDVMLSEGLDGGLPEQALRDAVNELDAAAQALSDERLARLQAIDGFRSPVALSSLSDADLAEFDAVFVPGGHGPMVDLADNADVGRLLGILHEKRAPITALCHAPAMLLSAPERADGQWLFEGYRLTAFTNEEEEQNKIGRIGMPWLLASALQNAGAVYDDAPFAWASHVVVDRNLITGQNPNSADATADALLKALDR
ncbi:DJ-1/PfpI family protein [Gordonia hydrophobica]|uniref:DJ-1/PfpI family protein n=1 Tax=Gordonia hydrophobica TaxID=40516 RepID=A0ABZ2U4F6_9ACTN|nr:DJ-1/PfpI family protein [Gordonia hydrophobica]MBM7368087.1 putative intracellular protease/amidase [Gordonia hydrophobica]